MILAEAALEAGDLQGFIDEINNARQNSMYSADLPDLALPAAAGSLDFPYEFPAVDAWSILDQERYAWTWLTGMRLFDLDRWNHPFLAGGFLAGNVPGADAINPRLSCMPVPRNECELNPNLAGSPVCG